MNFKVDSSFGEDLKNINSPYYKNLIQMHPSLEDKVTIASGQMNIDLNVINNSESSWRIDAIHLNINHKTIVPLNIIKSYKWPYKMRGENDEIFFNINNTKLNYSYIPKNLVVNQSGNGDNLLNIVVNTTGELINKHLVLNFKIAFDLVEIGTNNKTYIESDRSYLLNSFNFE